MRKREILGPDFGGVLEVLPGDMRERPLEIGEVFFGETNGPATGVGEFVASPYIRSRYRLGENLGHRRRSFAAYAAAAAQLYGWTAKITAGVPVPAWHTHGTRQSSPRLGDDIRERVGSMRHAWRPGCASEERLGPGAWRAGRIGTRPASSGMHL